MQRILFLLQNSNTYGLYESFAETLRSAGLEPIFLDLSLIANSGNKELYETNKKSVKEKGYRFLEYDLANFGNFSDYRFTLRMMDEVQPILLVVPFESYVFQLFIILAKERAIPSIHIQHGLWSPGKFLEGYNYHPELKGKERTGGTTLLKCARKLIFVLKYMVKRFRYPGEFRKLILKYNLFLIEGIPFPLHSDFISVPSAYYKDIVLNEVKHYREDQVIVNGYMRDNIFWTQKNKNLADLFELPPGREIISYFYTPFYLYRHRYIESYNSLNALIDFIQTCRKVYRDKNPFILILIHPTQVHDIPHVREQLISEGITDFLIDTSRNRQGHVYKESILIAGSKTAALLEARTINPRVLRQNYILKGNFLIEERFGGITDVDFPGDLEKKIQDLKSNPPPLKCELTDSLFGRNVGSSGRKLYEILAEKKILPALGAK